MSFFKNSCQLLSSQKDCAYIPKRKSSSHIHSNSSCPLNPDCLNENDVHYGIRTFISGRCIFSQDKGEKIKTTQWGFRPADIRQWRWPGEGTC